MALCVDTCGSLEGQQLGRGGVGCGGDSKAGKWCLCRGRLFLIPVIMLSCIPITEKYTEKEGEKNTHSPLYSATAPVDTLLLYPSKLPSRCVQLAKWNHMLPTDFLNHFCT